jgi:quercetin dioxygenase-like cupin family protein
MKVAQTLMIGIAALGVSLFVAPAQAAEEHVLVLPDKVQWGPAPPVLPAGAKAAVLYGDPAKEGQFALRIKLPKGYHVPPHTHPVDENVTVISGSFQLGMGKTADQSKAKALPAGSFFSLPPGMAHYAYIDEETVIQINTVGPWSLKYVNPDDDPSKKK